MFARLFPPCRSLIRIFVVAMRSPSVPQRPRDTGSLLHSLPIVLVLFAFSSLRCVDAATVQIDQSDFGSTATVIDFDEFSGTDVPEIPGITSITSPSTPPVLLIDPCCPSAWGSGDPGTRARAEP